MGCFTDGGTSSATGQKGLTILMATAFIVLCLCLVGILLSDGADSAVGDEFTEDLITYRVISESDATVTVYSSNFYDSSTNVSIPDTVDHNSVEYDVVSISNNAFSNQYNITSISIGDNVRAIGNSAFLNCGGLTSVNLNSVESIGKEAFLGCYSLSSIFIPKSVTSLGEYIFSYCTGLTAINVDADNPTYSSVDGVLFNKDKSDILIFPRNRSGEYSVPATVTSIANGVFQNCKISSVSFLGNTTSIGDNSFDNCDSLISISLPNSLVSIGVAAFSGCDALESISIPSGVKSLSDLAFSECSKLSSVSLPDNMTSIGEKAFMDCSSLEGIDLPDDLETIGVYAFKGCVGFTSIIIPDKVTAIGSFHATQTSMNMGAFEGCTNLVSVTFGKSVQLIGQRSFSGCTKLTNVTLPESVTLISNYAFYRCYGLTSMVIPDKVTEIGYSAFEWCNGLTSVTIGNGVTTIKGMAFCDCQNLQTLVIGENVTDIEDNALFRLYDLANLTMPISLNLLDNGVSSLFFNSKEVVDITLTPGTGDGFDDYAPNFNYDSLPWNYHYIGDPEVKKTFILRFANGIDSLGAHDFDGFSFFDSDGVTPLDNTVADLCGYVYIGTFDRMVRQAVDTYERTVSFDANGGTGTMDPIDVLTFDRFYPECTFTPPSGMSFLGWALTSNGDVLISPICVSEDTTLYAKWGVKKVTVTFMVDGKEYGEPLIVDSGTVVDPPKGPILDGFVFRGWSPDIPVQVLDDTVFTAIFAKVVTITYLVDGEPVREVNDHAEGDTVSVWDVYVKEGYTVSGWYTDDVVVDNGQFILGAKDVTFTATSEVNQYSVTYEVDGVQVGDVEEYDHGTLVQLRDRYFKEGYDVSSWECGLVTVENGWFTLGAEDITFRANSALREYEVYFKLPDGTIVNDDDYIMQHFEVIVAPDDPVIAGTDTLVFNFVEWSGFTPGMIATEDVSFVAVFLASPASCPDPVDGDMKFSAEAFDELQLGTDIMEEAKSVVGVGASSLSVLFNFGSISFDGQALSDLDGSEIIAIKNVSDSDVPQNISSEVNDRPVFSVTVGDVHEFGDGTLTIRLKYVLGSGESANNIEIWHYRTNGTRVTEDCVYDADGGYVEFSTDNLSYFAIMHVEPSGDGDGDNDGDDGGGVNIGLIAGIAVGVLAVIGIAAFLFFRRS